MGDIVNRGMAEPAILILAKMIRFGCQALTIEIEIGIQIKPKDGL